MSHIKLKIIKNLFELKNEKTLKQEIWRGDLCLFFKNRFLKKTKNQQKEQTPFLFCINKV